MSAYGYLHGLAADTLAEWKSGTVTLTRTTRAAPNPSTPHVPGAVTSEDVYDLDAVVRGAVAFADGVTVIATDLMVVASPIARLAGTPVAIVPAMSDVIHVDGARKAIKRIQPSPASGDAAVYRIFVAS